MVKFIFSDGLNHLFIFLPVISNHLASLMSLRRNSVLPPWRFLNTFTDAAIIIRHKDHHLIIYVDSHLQLADTEIATAFVEGVSKK